MKPWKVASLILLVLTVAAVGYGMTLVRRGFSALATPSAAEEFVATTARKLAVPSAYRQLRNPTVPSESSAIVEFHAGLDPLRQGFFKEEAL